MEAVEFEGAIWKVTTLADGGIRITIDLAENNVMQAAELMEIRRQGFAVRARLEPIELRNDGTGN
jgi:hypothetical protein